MRYITASAISLEHGPLQGSALSEIRFAIGWIAGHRNRPLAREHSTAHDGANLGQISSHNYAAFETEGGKNPRPASNTPISRKIESTPGGRFSQVRKARLGAKTKKGAIRFVLNEASKWIRSSRKFRL